MNLPVDEKLVAAPFGAISALRQQFAHLVALPPVHLRVYGLVLFLFGVRVSVEGFRVWS